VSGFGTTAVVTPLDRFIADVQVRFQDPSTSKILVVGGQDGKFADIAIFALNNQGYLDVAEVRGGFPAWTAAYRPNGEPRAASGGWMSADGREELFGTGG